MTVQDPITRAVARNLCTGCGACAALTPAAIRMVEDPVHGRRPVVAATQGGRIAAQEAAAVCAGLGADHRSLPRADATDLAWGPVLAVWQGWAADDEIRHRGSSGGAVTALALFALQSGLARGVAHVAARKDDPRRNEATISRTRADLLRGAGSRYAQASPAEALAEIAAGADPVAFIGKPCDVASVSRAAAADPSLAGKLPLTIAIFCAGAPNLRATDRLLDHLGMPGDATPTALRYRGDGWPGLMQARWRDASGAETESRGITYAEGWGRILQADRRWRCRICTDHTGAFADISVGDPWHEAPEGETAAGRSLIVARTARGRRLIESAIAAGALVAVPEARDAIARAQPNLQAAQGAVWGRRLAMRAVGLPVPADRGLPLFAAWCALPLRAKLSSVAGTLRRIWRNRLWQPVEMESRP
ncbi:Coenzyme F420 hydrogenase/dehydrogenase, beta subunit C-terminal domain [Neotabrizicola shimadae]|uniref:Coenzyme F420 hydrogenase/dehydrogenase, beta subunit C-terminal domain n=1 Tax=Neotabrizicola shimadae TaxID=2807096 RepID=A0A8G0ZV61_9RHOB|nr:Coenzyme F420 hydrogenase/dehydrogenase, beta subunit C-terminal domain [Neotabrizicola shimadae]QYZ69225.1 Coenzyme F420 hydrogenase/dehydrogenase, beta subunit C-terminal domain [Neotabrizicola shimadae]